MGGSVNGGGNEDWDGGLLAHGSCPVRLMGKDELRKGGQGVVTCSIKAINNPLTPFVKGE